MLPQPSGARDAPDSRHYPQRFREAEDHLHRYFGDELPDVGVLTV